MHFKVEGCALGLFAGPTRIEKFGPKMVPDVLRVVHVPAALASEPSWVMMDVQAISRIVCALGFAVDSVSYVLCVSSNTNHQDLGL